MSDALDVLNLRLAKGEIGNEDYADLLATIRRTRKDDGPNVALISLSAIGLFGILAFNSVTEAAAVDESDLIYFWPGYYLIWLLMALWVRALWNNIVPGVIGWRRLSFWEAAGILLLVALVRTFVALVIRA